MLGCMVNAPDLVSTCDHAEHTLDGELLPGIVGETDPRRAADCLSNRIATGSIHPLPVGDVLTRCGVPDACVIGADSDGSCSGTMIVRNDLVDDELVLLGRTGGQMAGFLFHEMIHTVQGDYGSRCVIPFGGGGEQHPVKEVEATCHQRRMSTFAGQLANTVRALDVGGVCPSLNDISAPILPSCLAGFLEDEYGYDDPDEPFPREVCEGIKDFGNGAVSVSSITLGIEEHHADVLECVMSETFPIEIASEEDDGSGGMVNFVFSTHHEGDTQIYQFEVDDDGARTLVNVVTTGLDYVYDLRIEQESAGVNMLAVLGHVGTSARAVTIQDSLEGEFYEPPDGVKDGTVTSVDLSPARSAREIVTLPTTGAQLVWDPLGQRGYLVSRDAQGRIAGVAAVPAVVAPANWLVAELYAHPDLPKLFGKATSEGQDSMILEFDDSDEDDYYAYVHSRTAREIWPGMPRFASILATGATEVYVRGAIGNAVEVRRVDAAGSLISVAGTGLVGPSGTAAVPVAGLVQGHLLQPFDQTHSLRGPISTVSDLDRFQVRALRPSRGPESGGTMVSILLAGNDTVQTVRLGGASVAFSQSASRVSFYTPSGTGVKTIELEGAQLATTVAGTFHYDADTLLADAGQFDGWTTFGDGMLCGSSVLNSGDGGLAGTTGACRYDSMSEEFGYAMSPIFYPPAQQEIQVRLRMRGDLSGDGVTVWGWNGANTAFLLERRNAMSDRISSVACASGSCVESPENGQRGIGPDTITGSWRYYDFTIESGYNFGTPLTILVLVADYEGAGSNWVEVGGLEVSSTALTAPDYWRGSWEQVYEWGGAGDCALVGGSVGDFRCASPGTHGGVGAVMEVYPGTSGYGYGFVGLPAVDASYSQVIARVRHRVSMEAGVLTGVGGAVYYLCCGGSCYPRPAVGGPPDSIWSDQDGEGQWMEDYVDITPTLGLSSGFCSLVPYAAGIGSGTGLEVDDVSVLAR
jgi:hypothetical protein